MEKMPLSLDPEPGDPGSGTAADALKTQPAPKPPVMGWCAVGFGLLGIFLNGPVFVPLGFVCSLVALFLGQVAWAFTGFLLAVAGLLTSPVLLALLGLAWLASYLGLMA